MSQRIDFVSFFKEQADLARARLEAHQAACKLPVCDDCERWQCSACLVPLARAGSTCPVCESKQRRAQWLDGALETLPRAFLGAALDAPWLVDLVGADTIARARATLGATRITFVGKPGSGKTSLAIAMFRAAVEADRSGSWRAQHMFVSAHRLAKARGTHKLGEEAPLVDSALRAPLLVIDELGGEDQRHASAVTEVIYERHAEDRPTWITTGVTVKEIAARYGGGISRRVFEGVEGFRLGKVGVRE